MCSQVYQLIYYQKLFVRNLLPKILFIIYTLDTKSSKRQKHFLISAYTAESSEYLLSIGWYG